MLLYFLLFVADCSIPKLLIQTGPEQMISEVRGFPEKLQEKNSDFEYRFFSDDAALKFMEEHYPETEILEVYQDPKMKAVMKADLFRYAAVAVLGGFYFDMDVYAYRNLGPLLSNTAVFPKEWQKDDAEFLARHGTLPENEEEKWQMGNYAFGAEPGHPLVQDALAEAFKRTKHLLNSVSDESEIKDLQVLQSTGPYMLSEVYHGGLKEGKYGDVNFLAGGNEIPFQARSHGSPTWHKFGKYAEHALAHSWVRRRLASVNELAEMLWNEDADAAHGIHWQRGLVEELKKRRESGEAILADKDEDQLNMTGMGGGQSAVGSHQYSDDDLQRAVRVLQKHFVRLGKEGMEIAFGDELYNTKADPTLNAGDECRGRDNQPRCADNMICEDTKRRGVDVNSCDPGRCVCAVVPQTLNAGDECRGRDNEPRCADNMICEDSAKGGVDVNSCEPGQCRCAVVQTLNSAAGILQFHVKKPLFQAKKKKKSFLQDSQVSQSDEIANQYPLRIRVFTIGAIMFVIGLITFVYKKKKYGDMSYERIHLLTEA